MNNIDAHDGLREDLHQLIRVALTNPSDLRGFIEANYPKEYAQYPARDGREVVPIMEEALMWLHSALNCETWHWDPDQREAAQYCYDKAKATLSTAAGVSYHTPEAADDIRQHIEAAFKKCYDVNNPECDGSEADLMRYLYSEFDLLMRKYLPAAGADKEDVGAK